MMKEIALPSRCPICDNHLVKDDYLGFYYWDCPKVCFISQVSVLKNNEHHCNFVFFEFNKVEITFNFNHQQLYFGKRNTFKSDVKYPLPDLDYNDLKSVVKKLNVLMAFL